MNEKLSRLKSKTEQYRHLAVSIGDQRSEVTGQIRDLEMQRRKAEHSRMFFPDEKRSAAEHRRQHIAKIDEQIEKLTAEREQLAVAATVAEQRYSDAQHLLIACEKYAKEMEVA